MSQTVNAFDHKVWASYNLENYGDFSDKINECNMRDTGDGTEGEWFYIPERPLPNGDHVVYFGTWGNYNSPGCDTYTYAEMFDDTDEFNERSKEWESKEEWLESEEEEDDEDGE